MARTTCTIALDAAGIDEASEAIASYLQSIQLDRRSALSVRLSLEDVLMQLAEHFGNQATAMIAMGMRFGHPRIIVRVRGERFDPRATGTQSDWDDLLLEASGLRPVYSYNGGHNIITATLPRKPLSGTIVTFLSIAFGAIAAYAGTFLPDGVREGLLTDVVTPLFDTFVSMLAGLGIPAQVLGILTALDLLLDYPAQPATSAGSSCRCSRPQTASTSSSATSRHASETGAQVSLRLMQTHWHAPHH